MITKINIMKDMKKYPNGNLTLESYIKASKELNDFIEQNEKNELKKEKKVLIEGFKTFDLSKDLETLDKLIIQEYTKNTFYGDESMVKVFRY